MIFTYVFFFLFPFCKNTFISGKTLKGREYEKTVRNILLIRQRHRAEFIISMKKRGVNIIARVARGSGVYVPELDLKADPHVSILKHLRCVRTEMNFQGERKADLIHSSYLCPGK